MQLWAACSRGLRKSLHNDGASLEKDVERLMTRIKSLAVKGSNNLREYYDPTRSWSGT